MSSIQSVEQPQHNEVKRLDKIIIWLTWGGIFSMLAIVIALYVFFQWNREFYISEEIDASVWGQYGDFLGGAIGTIIAFISILCLLKAYREQRYSNFQLSESNQQMRKSISSSEKVAEEQIVKGTYDTLVNLYHESLLGYKSNGIEGHEALDTLVNSYIKNEQFVNNEPYKKKSKEAMRVFSKFITDHYSSVSTHMRIVYQLLDLIANATIKRDKRRRYAKILRSQMSEGELILLRYNCMTARGQKTGRLVFEYNLLKHLPLLSLFEFKPITTKIADKNLISRLSEEMTLWRRDICRLFLSETSKHKEYDYTQRYKLIYEVTQDNKQFKLIFHRDVTLNMGRPYDVLPSAFNKLDAAELDNLFLWFLTEIFVVSHFRLYNNDMRPIQHVTDPNNNADTTNLTIIIVSDEKLVVHPAQLLKPSA